MMKKMIPFVVLLAFLSWVFFATILLGNYAPTWLPTNFAALKLPKTTADLGQSFSMVDGLLSSLALVLGLFAVLVQVRQQADSNVIGALSSRQQFMMAESERLEQQIQALKAGGKFEQSLFINMVEKKKRLLLECRDIDARLQRLLSRI